MSPLDNFILAATKLAGLGIIALLAMSGVSVLAWWLYKQVVGWPVILAALKHYRHGAPLPGDSSDQSKSASPMMTASLVGLVALTAFLVLFALKTRITVNFFDTDKFTIVAYDSDKNVSRTEVVKARNAQEAELAFRESNRALIVCAVFDGTFASGVMQGCADASPKP